MSKVIVSKQLLDNINDAISSASGDIKNRTLTEMANSIPSGDGEKSANFYDYDGTLIAAYSKAEIDNMTALPDNPSHEGLTAQGWNWTLQEIKSYLASYPSAIITIGQMYVTTSGATQIDVEFDDENYLSPYLVLAVNGTVEVDWGDGSSLSTITGNSLTTKIYTQHIYSAIGNYTIKISVSSGSFTFYDNQNINGGVLHLSNNNIEYSKIYSNYIKKIRLGIGITSLGLYAFNYCLNLKSITMPKTVTTINGNSFGFCTSLIFIVIPFGVESLINSLTTCYLLKNIAIPTSTTYFSNSFQYCQSLKNIIIPTGTTYLGNLFQNDYQLKKIIIPNTVKILDSTFYGLSSLETVQIPANSTVFKSALFRSCSVLTDNIVIPSGTTHISQYMFYSCQKIKKVTFSTPSTVRGVGNYAFQNCYSLKEIQIPSGTTMIGTSAFAQCHSLEKVVIPGTVSTIGASAFAQCYNVKEYHIQATTPPGAPSTTVFQNAGTMTTFYVPTASVNTYKADSIFSTWADQIVGE